MPSTGTPANAGGSLIVSGLSVLFLTVMLPPAASFGKTLTSICPASMPAKRSTTLAVGLPGLIESAAPAVPAAMATARRRPSPAVTRES